jgi:hypothetical protein
MVCPCELNRAAIQLCVPKANMMPFRINRGGILSDEAARLPIQIEKNMIFKLLPVSEML